MITNNIEHMIGKKVLTVHADGHPSNGGSLLAFDLDDGTRLHFTHRPVCCDDVWLEDVTGDLKDLEGHVILLAQERSADDAPCTSYQEWTFYEIRTVRTSVTLRFLGDSDSGMYSVTADVEVEVLK